MLTGRTAGDCQHAGRWAGRSCFQFGAGTFPSVGAGLRLRPTCRDRGRDIRPDILPDIRRTGDRPGHDARGLPEHP